jgi:hypothetical protein
MTYSIFLRRHDGVCKVSVFESKEEDAARQLSLYLFRHYPVSFFDDETDAAGDMEKVLKDCRTGKIVWRQGDTTSKIEEGEFYVEQDKEPSKELRWWESALPASKKVSIELDIQNAWKKGFAEGYGKGLEEGREQGYRQGVRDKSLSVVSK